MPATVNAIPITETEARALADAIDQVSNAQPPDTALKLIEMALARAPQQPLVLNAAAGHMVRSGNAGRARDLFEPCGSQIIAHWKSPGRPRLHAMPLSAHWMRT